MHRAIGYLSKRFVQIRPGEGRKALLTFLYFFLIITSYYVIKPVSRSMALGRLGSRMVPYMDLVCALVMGPVVTVFARLVDRMSKARLVSLAFWTIIAVMASFWKLLHWHSSWVVGMFYVWVSIFSVLVVTLFWLVANDLFRPREAKRLFGFIGSGGILGGIVGSSIAAVGAQVVGTEQLLLLSSGLLILCWVVVQQLWRFAPDLAAGEEGPKPSSRHDTFLAHPGGFVKLLLQSRYLLLLVALVGLNKLIATLTYYQFNPFIEHAFPNQDMRTTFTSVFFGGVNITAFIVQFFFTSWILRRWGLSVSLLALPLGLLTGTIGLVCLPVLWVAATTELYDGAMNYSLQQTAKEVLYLPIDRSIRYKVKPFIDMVVFRFGKGIAAIIGILILNGLNLPPRVISYLAIPLIAVWIWVALRLRREYVATIRTVLQARAASRRAASHDEGAVLLREADGSSRREETAEPFGSLTDGQPSARKLVLVDQLIAAIASPAPHTRALLEELIAYEHHVESSSEFEMERASLKAVIADPLQSMAKRRQAVRLITRLVDQETVDHLLGMVMVDADALLRQEAVKGLVRMRLRKPVFEFPVRAIHRQVAHEVANYQRIVQVASIFRQQHRNTLAADDPVLALLRVLMEESIEQVFRLLMLLYSPEDIHLIYEQVRAADGYVRADAIELLDNLIDPALRGIIVPILDEDRFLAGIEATPAPASEPTVAYRVLQEAIWDHNSWLSVTTLCAVGRLRLPTMRQELEKASRHAAPIISKAAKVALHLSSRP